MGDGNMTCRYCDRTLDNERAYTTHLHRAHDRAELDRIDRRRVEQLFGDGTMTAELAWWLRPVRDRLDDVMVRRVLDEYRAMRIPVPTETLWNMALFGIVATIGVALLLAMG